MAADREISSVIACPLFVGPAPVGVLRLDSSKPGTYNQDDLRFLDILLGLIAAAVTNARLFAKTQLLAVTDGLTNLMLRRPFLEQAARELTRSGRSREPVSLLMVDVDHFKRYNDSYGHTAGDVILREVAEALRTGAPPDAVVGRYGGEEFVVLLPKHSKAKALGVAEQIRLAVERQGEVPRASDPGQTRRTAIVGMSHAVTVSIGVATFPEDGKAELELIRAADRRLYQAKQRGRNAVSGD
jgi:diguanylate cyclase (GGDEF)-like protein